MGKGRHSWLVSGPAAKRIWKAVSGSLRFRCELRADPSFAAIGPAQGDNAHRFISGQPERSAFLPAVFSLFPAAVSSPIQSKHRCRGSSGRPATCGPESGERR
ncbi:hypothetical protein VUR80DRAFT_2911 [Thermomyces stellatus]